MSATKKLEITLHKEQETIDFAEKIACLCKKGDCVLLYGDLGTGKTTFARGFIKALTGTKEEISSPTYTLVHTYALPDEQAAEIWHCDLYRIRNEEELEELGIEEAIPDNIVIIEWPEIIADRLSHGSLKITLAITEKGRNITVYGNDSILEKLNAK